MLLAAPNATVIRHTVGSIDPTFFNVIKYGLLAAGLLPYVLIRRKTFTKLSLKYAVIAGASMAAAITSFVWAVYHSQASHVVIITLLTPIILILYSIRLNKERVTKRSIAGISLAAAGAFMIVALPIALQNRADFQFYGLATALALVNCLTFPLATIYAKKANDAGISLLSVSGITTFIAFAVSLVVLLVRGGTVEVPTTLSLEVIAGIAYSALGVALSARILGVASYEHIGATAIGALFYLEMLIAIIIPVLFLHEKISVELIVGGVLILLGIYVVEHRSALHHRHFNFSRHH